MQRPVPVGCNCGFSSRSSAPPCRHPQYEHLPQFLRLAEQLAAAGHRPTVYRNCENVFCTAHPRPLLPEFDPLKHAPEGHFELHFSNRCVHRGWKGRQK